MKTSITSKQSITSKVVKAIKSSYNSIVEPRRFVNHDGTIAESRETYKEFHQDVISSFGRC